jgi:uncharacterized membrane protein YeaQ/YmgE (transglycosylase-associated protein family)
MPYHEIMREATWFAMFLGIVGAVIAVTQLSDVADAVLPSTSGLLSTIITALPFVAVLMVPLIVVFWLAQK